MKIENVYDFFANAPVNYLSIEQAVCYVLSVLLERESYGTELIQKLESEYSGYRLSDTVLYAPLINPANKNTLSRCIEIQGLRQVCPISALQYF